MLRANGRKVEGTNGIISSIRPFALSRHLFVNLTIVSCQRKNAGIEIKSRRRCHELDEMDGTTENKYRNFRDDATLVIRV